MDKVVHKASTRRCNCAVGAVVLAAAFIAGAADGQRQRPFPSAREDESVERLAEEVRNKGWVVFCARSDKGDWDLFLCRPDGSSLYNITRTPLYSELAPQFSRDGRRLLYRRLPREEQIDGNQYGAQGELVFANSDGTDVEVLGKSGQFPWASWGPDGRQIVCLSIDGVFFVDIASRQTVRRLDRKGFFQQLTWSPDGKWLSGVANSFGTGWSVARMNAATGLANAVSRVDCCTPDWFPDSKHLVFSNRPPGQKANNGYGWTQLWMADGQEKACRLVYGEEGRHVYGGHVSPDGKYVLFTGNMHEDGDPGNAGARMGLMRLADAPIVAGESTELRALHRDAKNGPVLALPIGWEPCWTFAEVGPRFLAPATGRGATALAAEVRDKGWIVFSAATGNGDWDLVLMRPDGSDRRRVTSTDKYNEAGARFSPDGKRLLYFRLPSTERIDNNTYGTYELIVANSDGTEPVVYGDGFHWASWGPDSRQIACLDKNGIQIIDFSPGHRPGYPSGQAGVKSGKRRILRQIPRKGIVQQLVWSPDGRWFVGTANGLGVAWTIGCLNADTGNIDAVSETDRYNCTPDWLADSQHIIYSRGIVPNMPGWTQLWVANSNGQQKRLLYAEQGRHMYGGCVSPDGKYILFTRSEKDLGRVDNSRTRMAIIRWKDTPMVGGNTESLRKEYPAVQSGPLLDLSSGWEPHWTYSDVVSASSSGVGMSTGRD